MKKNKTVYKLYKDFLNVPNNNLLAAKRLEIFMKKSSELINEDVILHPINSSVENDCDYKYIGYCRNRIKFEDGGEILEIIVDNKSYCAYNCYYHKIPKLGEPRYVDLNGAVDLAYSTTPSMIKSKSGK